MKKNRRIIGLDDVSPVPGDRSSRSETAAAVLADAARDRAGRRDDRTRHDQPRRGRPPGPAKPARAESIFPPESLAELHTAAWTWIAKALRSRYQLSEKGALEMGRCADLLIRKYIGPALEDNAELAAYSFTQLTALLACVALRDAGDKPAAPAAPAAAAPRAPDPPPLYESGPSESELRSVPG